ncbi:hypothetical protein HanPSC8_Chr13g0592971 [Helianthus annuus]|nr:hypothetical protein HanPSC8_Chr13g0592971 [Helianthus annuus]
MKGCNEGDLLCRILVMIEYGSRFLEIVYVITDGKLTKSIEVKRGKDEYMKADINGIREIGSSFAQPLFLGDKQLF